jgi:hypothetical protein
MRLEERSSAKRVAGIALGCSLVVFFALWATALPVPPGLESSRFHGEIVYELSLFALAVAAGIQMYIAIEAFKRGVAEEIWSQASIDRLRAVLERRVYTVLLFGFIVFALAYVFIDLLNLTSHRHHHSMTGGLIYFWMSPATTLAVLRVTLRPRPKSRGGSIWLGEVKPIVSEHWGERGPAGV